MSALALGADDDDERAVGEREVGQLDVTIHVEADDEVALRPEVLQRSREVRRPGATGTRAAAPADDFQALAVIPTDRRDGTTTPCPPNAATDRMIAPRLRGSVIPSSATTRGMPGDCGSTTSDGCAYSYGGTWIARPWWTAPSVSRSSSPRGVSRTGMPRSVAVVSASRTRSSASIRPATYIVVTGTAAPERLDDGIPAGDDLAARGALAGPRPGAAARPRTRDPPEPARRSADRATLKALWFGRSAALGVGPRPLEGLATLPARADGRALLGLADGTAPPGAAGHQDSFDARLSDQRAPPAVSSTAMPSAVSTSLIASAVG